MTYLITCSAFALIGLGLANIATHRRLPKAVDARFAERLELTQSVLGGLAREGLLANGGATRTLVQNVPLAPTKPRAGASSVPIKKRSVRGAIK